MQRLSPRERAVVWFWLILATVVWNGIYDVLLSRSTKDYLLRAALYESGHAPAVTISHAMHVAVRDAIWIASFWAGVILLAGLITMRAMRRA